MKLSRRDLFRAGGAATVAALLPPAASPAAAGACQAFADACPPVPPPFAFSVHEQATFVAAANRILPPFDNGTISFRGAGNEGAFEYVNQLLNAFQYSPPRIYPSARAPGDPPGIYIGTHGHPSECHGGHLAVPGGWLALPPEKELGWRRAIARFQATYRKGLAALDQGGQAIFGRLFVDLLPAEQTALLESYDAANEVPRITYVYSAGGGEPALQSRYGGFNSDGSLLVATLFVHTMEAIYGDPIYRGLSAADQQAGAGRIGWKLAGFGGPRHPEGYYPQELETHAVCDRGLPANQGVVPNLVGAR